MTPAQLGFVRGVGSIILMGVLTYLADASHLNGLVSVSVATIIAGLAAALESSLSNGTGTALFGAVNKK